MAKTLEAHDKLIREIFEGEYQFEIPDYQRPYAWTRAANNGFVMRLCGAFYSPTEPSMLPMRAALIGCSMKSPSRSVTKSALQRNNFRTGR
jgi:hypothetical protein